MRTFAEKPVHSRDEAPHRVVGSTAQRVGWNQSPSGDMYEQEADRISEAVMRMSGLQSTCACGGGCPSCQTGQHEPLQTKRINADTPQRNAAPPIVNEVMAAPGQPLNHSTLSFMESRFGHNFGDVRIHTDQVAAESAQAVNAIAYTVGRDVVFGRGQYAPETVAGQRLLAHELTHVVQQDHGRQQNKSSTGSLQRAGGDAAPPAFDWSAKVKEAERLAHDPATKPAAETIYKELVIRAAGNIAAVSPLVDRKPSAEDIIWSWHRDPQHPHGAEVDPKLIDNHPMDYWKWVKFMPGAVRDSAQVDTEGTILHELDHAAHAKAIYDGWVTAGRPGGSWDTYWVEHYERWAEDPIPTEGGILKGIAGLPETIRPSAIEFRAYTSDLIHSFHRVDRNRQAYLARTVVLFYPVEPVPADPAGISDPSIAPSKTRLQLLLYYSALRGVEPAQRANVKTLLAYEMNSALIYRPGSAHAQIKSDFNTIFSNTPSPEEARAATDAYVPAP